MKVAIQDIVIGERVRKDMGDLFALAGSIDEIGLLQPIGVTKGRHLAFGERRLRAVKDILRWTHIEARIVNLDAIILGEFHENAIRKDFTVSGRVAIGKALEAYLGNHQGRRTDKELRVNLPEVEPGKRTRDIAAEKAGFGSETTYRQAKQVVDHAEPELVDAVDAGALPLPQAAKVVDADPEVQRQVANLQEER